MNVNLAQLTYKGLTQEGGGVGTNTLATMTGVGGLGTRIQHPLGGWELEKSERHRWPSELHHDALSPVPEGELLQQKNTLHSHILTLEEQVFGEE